MSQSGRRFLKALLAVALFNGMLYLCLSVDLQAADKELEAKKYASELRSSKDAKTKITALQELGRLGRLMRTLVADAMPDIYKAMEDKDAGVRAAAAYCLGECDEPADKSVPALLKLLKDDKDESVKIGAAKGLAAMGPSAKDALKDLNAIRTATAADKKSKLGVAAKAAIKSIQRKKD